MCKATTKKKRKKKEKEEKKRKTHARGNQNSGRWLILETEVFSLNKRAGKIVVLHKKAETVLQLSSLETLKSLPLFLENLDFLIYSLRESRKSSYELLDCVTESWYT